MPLIARELRLEVAERMDADGKVLTPLDEAAVAAAARTLLGAGLRGASSSISCTATSTRRTSARAAEIVRALWPNPYVTPGHADPVGIPRVRARHDGGGQRRGPAGARPLYRRACAASSQPSGFDRDLLVMQGNGGTISSRSSPSTAVKTVMSGPASGVIGRRAYTGRASGQSPTSSPTTWAAPRPTSALIEDGVPPVSGELELEYAMPIHVPMVDVHTIGAGGGSIASVDAAGMLRVGPESAGARPGPDLLRPRRHASRPSPTPTSCSAGSIPERLLAVDRPVVAATRARGDRGAQVGEPLGLDADAAAAAILRIANDQMAGAIRMVSLSRGHDPRDFALFAFGGAGPLHAVALARELGIPTVLVPARPGHHQRAGLRRRRPAPRLRRDGQQAARRRSTRAAIARTCSQRRSRRRGDHGARGRRGRGESRRAPRRHAVPGPEPHPAGRRSTGPDITLARTARGLRGRLLAALRRRAAGDPPVLVNLHTAVIGKRRRCRSSRSGRPTRAPDARGCAGRRAPVWFDGGWLDDAGLARREAAARRRFEGPAIIEQLDCTTVVEPGNSVRMGLGNLLIGIK